MAAVTNASGWWRPASRSARLWLGIVTGWPLLYLFLFIAGFALTIASGALQMKSPPQEPPPALAAGFGVLFLAHCLTTFATFALIVVYVISVINNPRLDQTMRIIWILLVLLGSMISMPIYWYLYMWRDPAEPAQG